MDVPLVLTIVGPTASGKTEMAVMLARALRDRGLEAEAINADSRQVYRGMSIGTAKPTLEQQAVLRHHLIDVADPQEGFSLALFLESAAMAINDVYARGKLPLVVGGTGQYVWGLLEGWKVPHVPPSADVRGRLAHEAKAHGPERLHARLRRIDPEAASLIDPRNVRRVIRALEVWEETGTPFSAQRKKESPAYHVHILGAMTDRKTLYDRIDRRVEGMVAAGWVREVETLLERNCSPELPAFSSVGYRDMAAFVRGEVPLEEAMARVRVATHRLARRQASWFRQTDERIHWVADFDGLWASVRGALAMSG